MKFHHILTTTGTVSVFSMIFHSNGEMKHFIEFSVKFHIRNIFFQIFQITSSLCRTTLNGFVFIKICFSRNYSLFKTTTSLRFYTHFDSNWKNKDTIGFNVKFYVRNRQKMKFEFLTSGSPYPVQVTYNNNYCNFLIFQFYRDTFKRKRYNRAKSLQVSLV